MNNISARDESPTGMSEDEARTLIGMMESPRFQLSVFEIMALTDVLLPFTMAVATRAIRDLLKDEDWLTPSLVRSALRATRPDPMIARPVDLSFLDDPSYNGGVL